MRKMREIEMDLIKGGSMTTPELEMAHKHYGRLREGLSELGQRWHFAFAEANRLWMMTNDYLNARKRDRD